MKSNLFKTFLVASLLGSGLPTMSEAKVLLSETFDYAEGTSLDNADGGVGWIAPWKSHPGQVETTIEKGQLVAKSLTNGGYFFRPIDIHAEQDGTLYFSVDFDNKHCPENPYVIGFRKEKTSDVLAIGNGAGRKQWGAWLKGKDWINSKVPSIKEPNAQRIVVALDFKNKQARLYMNPKFDGKEPVEDADGLVTELDMEPFSSLRLVRIVTTFVNKNLSNEPRNFDNIFVVSDWSDFASIPELKLEAGAVKQ